jgi:tol-pal system protein YbgF
MRLVSRLHLVVSALVLTSASAFAGTRDDIDALQLGQQDIDQRLMLIESQLQSQGLIEMLQMLQQMQTDLQQLRGDIEHQTNELEGLRKRQRELYLDIDRRLNDLQLQSGRPGASVPNTDTQQPGIVAGTLGVSGGDQANVDQERNEYKEAFETLREGRYPQAIEAFKALLAKYPAGAYSDNAQYWLGEANYVSRNFDQAIIEFNKVLNQFPRSAKVPDAKLKLGYTYYELQQWDKARAMLSEVVSKHPGTSVVPLAENRLQRMGKEGR